MQSIQKLGENLFHHHVEDKLGHTVVGRALLYAQGKIPGAFELGKYLYLVRTTGYRYICKR